MILLNIAAALLLILGSVLMFLALLMFDKPETGS